MPKLIAVTIGDINGIGIRILIDLLKNNKLKNIVLFSNILVIKNFLIKNNLKIKINLINTKNKNLNYNNKSLNIFSYNCNNNEENTYKSLKYSYDFCSKNICIGILTLPLRKDLIRQNVNNKFIGHTEYFQKIDNKKYSNMILFHKKIIVTTITTHRKISEIPSLISNKQFLYNQIINLNNTLKIDFNIKKPKLIISGLNPHAGENGEIGKEEINYIAPVIKKLKNKGLFLEGPASGDSMLIENNLTKYHCFIFIYHDQALIPFKFISQFSGVNYTGNLSVIRTSPDHGTAYNLIGKNNISYKSIINCYKLIKKIYKNRKIYEESKKITKPKFLNR